MIEGRIRIEIDFADRFYGLVAGVLPDLQKDIEKAVARRVTKEAAKDISVKVEPATAGGDILAAIRPETPVAPGDVKGFPTLEDIDTAVEATRNRLLGPDWRNDKENPKVRHLTQMFRAIAGTLEDGCNTPKNLRPERRQAWIDTVNRLIETADGKFVEQTPF